MSTQELYNSPKTQLLPASNLERERVLSRKPRSIWKADTCALVRLVLSAVALYSIFGGPLDWRRYLLLSVFTLYSAWGLALCLRPLMQRARFERTATSLTPWLDLGSYFLLAVLSSEPNNVYVFGFLFAVLVRAVRQGRSKGLVLAAAAAALSIAANVISAQAWGGGFKPEPALLHAGLLISFGFLGAQLGSYSLELKRRHELLNDIIKVSNPRFGVDYTLDSVLRRLREFYDAAACILVILDAQGTQYELRRANREPDEVAHFTGPMAEALARTLLCLPEHLAVIYDGAAKLTARRRNRLSAFDTTRQLEVAIAPELYEEVAATLAATSLITVPVRYQGRVQGRLFIVNPATVIKDTAAPTLDADAAFLQQVLRQVMPVIENIKLVDQLASHAAEHERQKIARDIHDSVIQPYIGFKFAVFGIKRKLEAGATDLLGDIEDLLALTDREILELRGFARGLRGAPSGDVSLVSAARRFAAKFSSTTGINVDVRINSNINIGDRLAAEVFQMITEGLSNVRRHTKASRATIALACTKETFTLTIGNEGTPYNPGSFSPGSIKERAEALGGSVSVQFNDQSETVLVITIPL